MPETVLLIGSGGREHAIARALSRSPGRPRILAAPGNPGTASLGENVSLDVGDAGALVAFCRERNVDLAVVGPEDPLIAGVADDLRAAGVSVFGPGAAGARLEGDKHFAKQVMMAAGVPTADFRDFDALEPALAHLATVNLPVVIKACGAAQGKGVAVCTERAEAEAFLRECLADDRFGAAGRHVLIEDCLTGPELSVLAVTDGASYALLAPSRDHKRVGEGDTGPNTGGMGAFAAGSLVPPGLGRTICDRVVEPVLAELRARGIDYRGVLYAGLMLTPEGPQVLEFNCRFGDPETQVVLPLVRADFAGLLAAAAAGDLKAYLDADDGPVSGAPADWPGASLTDWRRAAMVVVGAAEGYPGSYAKGIEIGAPRPDSDTSWLIHAGTRLQDGRLLSNGGRVLGAVGTGPGFADARSEAYGLIESIDCRGLFHRADIGAGFEDTKEGGA